MLFPYLKQYNDLFHIQGKICENFSMAQEAPDELSLPTCPTPSPTSHTYSVFQPQIT